LLYNDFKSTIFKKLIFFTTFYKSWEKRL